MSDANSAGSQLQVSACNLKSLFSEQGPLGKILPQYSLRREQLQLAEKIQSVLWQSDHAITEAGTGVGKSLAYLIPSIDWVLKKQARLVISTHTKALQSQLVDKDLPLLKKGRVFEQDFRVVLCLGAENYVCLLRLIQLSQQEMQPACDPQYAEGMQQLLEYCRGRISGIRQDIPFPFPDSVWRQVCVIKDLCLGKRCAYVEECYWLLAKQAQWEADILVTNHSLFFSHFAIGGRLLPDFSAAILDEAHKLEDVATDFLGAETSAQEIRRLLAEVQQKGRYSLWQQFSRLAPGNMAEIVQQARRLSFEQETWWLSLLTRFPAAQDAWRIKSPVATLSHEPIEALLILASALHSLAGLAETEETQKYAEYFADRIRTAATVQKQWVRAELKTEIYWAERGRNSYRGQDVTLAITPMDLGPRLREMVFETIPAVVLTSASLAVAGSFAYVRTRLGIPETAREVMVASPFDYPAQALLYLPRSIPDPREVDAFETAVIKECLALIRLLQGGVFVLCTSYRMLQQAARSFRQELPDLEILVQGEENAAQLLTRFRERESAVLLGVETFWQGVDVPGDALRCVVITRLPFDVPTQPIHQARLEYIEQQGANAFIQYSLPRAALMLKQGFGRLIRRHEDRGVVAILDPRIRSRSWGKYFLEALPAAGRTHEFKQVEQFVKRQFKQLRGE